MLVRLFTGVLLAAWLGCAQAAYPERVIRFILPSAPGGSVDVLMRILTQQLSVQMGVAFVIENKPGASFVPGTMDIVRAAPDGYTLGYGNIVSLAINYSLLQKVPYVVEKDLTLISNCVQVFNMLAVSNELPVRSVQELIDYAKKNPGKLNYGSVGAGGVNHLAFAWFNTMNGLEMQHVPYKGLVQGLGDIMTSRLDVMFAVIGGAAPNLKAGKMKGIAVSGKARNPLIPDVPTFAEAGMPAFDASFYFALAAPAGTPREMVAKMAADSAKVVQAAEFKEKFLNNLGFEAVGDTPEQFAAFLKGDRETAAKRVQASGAKLD